MVELNRNSLVGAPRRDDDRRITTGRKLSAAEERTALRKARVDKTDDQRLKDHVLKQAWRDATGRRPR